MVLKFHVTVGVFLIGNSVSGNPTIQYIPSLRKKN